MTSPNAPTIRSVVSTGDQGYSGDGLPTTKAASPGR